MSKQFAVITQDGSKWLRPWDVLSNVFDVIYLGSAEPGTSLSEEQVQQTTQYRPKDAVNADWQTWVEGAIKWDNVIETRTAYTDTESHDRHISDDYWKDRAKAAEKLIGISPSDPKTYDEFCRLREEWEEIVKQESK